MGKKLTVRETEFLFKVCLFLDSDFRDDYFRLLVVHFCDCAEENKSPCSDSFVASTTGGEI